MNANARFKAIGLKIREKRKEQNMTQVELAKRAHVSEAAISFFESGVKRLSIERLCRIADALNCSASEILREAERDNT